MRFLLVHGGTQGAWVWDYVMPELKALGHESVAVDLPGHGARRGEAATLEGYRQAVVDALEPGDILVGHSMGGYVVTVAADAVPERVRHIVYLAAGVPVEGLSMTESTGGNVAAGGKEIISGSYNRHIRFEPEGCFSIPSLESAIEVFFHDCSPEVAEWAFGKMNPQQLAPVTTPIHVPKFWAADLPRSFIQCTEDRSLEPQMAEQFIRRLNVSPLFIRASHSPFLSRPRETAELIIAASATVPLGPLRP